MVCEPQGWTTYGCNNFSDWDQIWLQSILVTKGTKYGCNHKFKNDHIWLQSFRIRTKYDCNLRNRARVTWLWIWTNLFKTKFRFLQSYLVPIWTDCNHIWSALNFWLQLYFVPCETNIAIIFGPFCDQDCNHIGPHHKNNCNHMWSSPIEGVSNGRGKTYRATPP